MISTLQFETRRLHARLHELVRVTGRDGDKLLTNAAKGVVRVGVEMTPPGWKGMSAPAAKKRGEAAVARDIRRVFKPARLVFQDLKQENPKLARQWWQAVRHGHLSVAERLMSGQSKIRDRNAIVTARLDPEMHESARKRGRVRRLRPVAILHNTAALKAYIKQRQQLVGYWAAGWLADIARLGGVTRLPKWVTRHAGIARGRVTITRGPRGTRITLANSTGFGSLQHILPYTLASATRGMQAQIDSFKKRALKKAGFKTTGGTAAHLADAA